MLFAADFCARQHFGLRYLLSILQILPDETDRLSVETYNESGRSRKPKSKQRRIGEMQKKKRTNDCRKRPPGANSRATPNGEKSTANVPFAKTDAKHDDRQGYRSLPAALKRTSYICIKDSFGAVTALR